MLRVNVINTNYIVLHFWKNTKVEYHRAINAR